MFPCQSLQGPCFDCDVDVHHGTIDQKAPGFLAFKQRYCSSWESIVFFLEHTEKLLKDYAVPLATINCKKLAEVASDFELNKKPTKSDILSVIKNQSTVEKILNRPGRRCKGQGGTEMAAAKIQATWRCYRARKASVQLRQQQRAAGVIAISWLLHNRMAHVKKALKESRQRHLENFYIRAKVCSATSCYGSTSFLNISCFSDCNKLFPFFFPFNHTLVRVSYFILHQRFSLCGCKICCSVSTEKSHFTLTSVVLSENQCFNCITLVLYIYLVALNLLGKKKIPLLSTFLSPLCQKVFKFADSLLISAHNFIYVCFLFFSFIFC